MRQFLNLHSTITSAGLTSSSTGHSLGGLSDRSVERDTNKVDLCASQGLDQQLMERVITGEFLLLETRNSWTMLVLDPPSRMKMV